MPQKIVGYVELEWTCKRCGTKNPGTQNVCSNCGAPMDAADQFELPEEQKLISDEKKLEGAAKGADFHCPYCGARNPSGTKECVQCGGDLKDAEARQAGQVIGAYQSGPAPEIECPFCASKIKAGLQRCPNCGGDLVKKVEAAPAPAPAPVPQKMPVWAIVGIVLFVLACCSAIGLYAVLSARTSDVKGQVQSVAWERTVGILEERPAQKEAWEESVPSDAANVTCQDRYRSTSSFPAPKSTEVCGTPYTVDQGSGVGKVVQDCEYMVYDSYCEFTVQEWQVVDQVVAGGSDLSPYWPTVNLQASQQQGESQERYQVVFSADGNTYEYTPPDEMTFAQFTPGSTWTLKINTFGVLTGVEP